MTTQTVHMKPGRVGMDLPEVQQMIEEYTSGLSLAAVGQKHYCNTSTVLNYLKREQIPRRGKGKFKYNVSMIAHDWNANVPISSMVKKYRISKHYLYVLISNLRSKGERMNNRSRLRGEERGGLNGK